MLRTAGRCILRLDSRGAHAHLPAKPTPQSQFHCQSQLIFIRRLASSRPSRKQTRKSALKPLPKSPVISKVRLRDYQEECITSVLRALKQGHKRVGISLATGSGKTVVFTQLIKKIPPRGDGDRTLILAHRRELVEQAARHCQAAYPGKTIEIEMGNVHASGTADITIGSVQSLVSKGRLDKYDPSAFKLVLVDEAHHIVASTYLKVLQHFGLNVKQEDSPALVGVSATFSRFDGVKLGAAIDEIVYHKDYVEMISDKWLADVVFTTVKSTANLSKVRSSTFGDFQVGELSRAVNTDEVNDIIIRSWMAKAGDRKSTLVFCVDLAHVSDLTERFRHYGYDARFVTGETNKVERGAILDAFKNGEFPVLVNCGIFTEGTDIPNIDCVVLARPTRSRNLLVQMIGRGMRLHPGKKNCHIIDMVSSLDTGIVSTPTLFGLDPSEIVTEATVGDMRQMKLHKEKEKESGRAADGTGSSSSVDAVTFTDYSSVMDLIADTSGEKHIRALSPLAWVQVPGDRFILGAPSGSYIRIERTEAQTSPPQPNAPGPSWRAVEVRALPEGISKSPFAAPRELLTAATFEDAVRGADNWAQVNLPRTFILRNHPWRKVPASPGQIDFINKFRGGNKPVTQKDLTKGAAADMITKLKHGARGHFSKISAHQRRRERQTSAARSFHDKENVRVGPVAM
ncbi:P-loop containing nucleoside triphosphate hydrolase protein [Stachybotrys elegans]|uniref:P-loop containing nucleoside triphosphate hydrolase protein n=1 Tax=Stachybotrys elegans TaxID=80388 RepID=A0A8K0WWG6_9HYPO|nr:P-loop containing nucleoside triphosphate hydrolase protein [Stachybotrys elegans]